MTEPSMPVSRNGDLCMKRHIALCLVAATLSACAPAINRAQGEASLPAEYNQAITPSHLKTYFDSHPAPPGERYGEVRIVGDAVVVEIQTWIGSVPIGTATVSLAQDGAGKRLQVTCEAKQPGGWLYIERDAKLLEEGITRHIVAGDHLRAAAHGRGSAAPAGTVDRGLQNSLIDAVRRGDTDRIEYWLEQGAVINGPGTLDTPLISAISADRGIKLIEFLLDKGADVNQAVPGFVSAGKTPLMVAAYEVRPEVVELLLERGADATLVDEGGKTALSYIMDSAYWGYKGEKLSAIFKALVAAGVKHDLPDKEGKTPLSYGMENREIPKAVLDLLRADDVKKALADLELREEKERALQAQREAEEARMRQQAEREAEAKRRKAEEAAKAQRKAMLAKLAKLGPIGVLSRDLTFNSIGVPEASIKIINAWNKTIDAYRVEIRCQDNFGRFLTKYGTGREPRFYGISQDIIRPGEESYDTWTLYGYMNATKFYARIIEVHFTDGTTWRAR